MKTEFLYLEHPSEVAIIELMSHYRDNFPKAGVLALIPEALKGLVPVLQQSANTTDIPLVGAIFPELIIGAEFRRDGFLLLKLDPMPDYCLHASLSDDRGWQSAIGSLKQLIGGLPVESTVLIFFDALFGRIASFLDDLYYEVGDKCQYVGGNAGSESFKSMACLFDRDNFVGDGVLAIALQDHSGAILGHGYKVPSEAITASSAENNRITQIGWEPAFDKYVELVREHYNVSVDRQNFYSMGVHFPFALHRGDGELLIRIPVAIDEKGALLCVGEIPEGALMNVAQAVKPGNLETVACLMEEYRARKSSGGLFFYCAGRRMHLGESASLELEHLAAAISPLQLMGILTLGEIGNSPEGGYPLFHNATIVALPLDSPA